MEATNIHLKQPSAELAISATLVTDENARMRCLPAIAGVRCCLLEHAIYDALGRICASYNGGYWDYFKLSNGGFYMAPHTDALFQLSCENYFVAEVNANTAGLIATASAYSELSFLRGGDCFAQAYHRLSYFIFQHPNAGVIRAALD